MARLHRAAALLQHGELSGGYGELTETVCHRYSSTHSHKYFPTRFALGMCQMKVNIQYMELWSDRYAEFTHELTTDLDGLADPLLPSKKSRYLE